MTVRPRRAVLAGLALAGCYHAPAEFSRPSARAWPAADAVPTGSGAPLGCDAALVAVLERDPTLRAARAGLAVARTDVDAAGRWDAPEVRVGDNVRDLGNESKVELRFRLPGPGVNGAETSAAEARVELTAAEIREVEVDVALAVRHAHAELRLAVARARLDREAANSARSRAELVASRASAGTVTAVAAMEARLAAAAAEDTATAAERALARQRARFAVKAGAPAVEDVACTAPAPIGSEAQAHPAVAMARAEAWEADATAFAESRATWIWPTFAQIGWAVDKAGNNREDRILFEFGVALPFPGTDEGDLARAEADHRRQAATAALDAARGAVEDAEATWHEALDRRAGLGARQAEIEAARALLGRGESAGAAPDDLAGLSKRLRDHAMALAEADFAVAVAAAEVFAARGLGATLGR